MIDFKTFKKTADDGKLATLEHPSGHKIQIVKAALSTPLKKQLERLPLHAASGAVVPDTDDTTKVSDSPSHVTNINIGQPPVGDPSAAGRAVWNADPRHASASPVSFGTQITAGTPQQSTATETMPGQVSAPEPVPGEVEGDKDAAAPSSLLSSVSGGTPTTPPQQVSDTNGPLAPVDPNSAFQGLPWYNQEQQGNAAMGEALSKQGVEAAKLYAGAAQMERQKAQLFQADLEKKSQDILAATQDIKNSHINPNSYLENMSTGSKIATAIGLFIGGIGAGKTGGPNPAMSFLNSQIERDLQAQKENLGTKATLLGALEKQYGDKIVAENMFRGIRAATLADQIRAAGATSQSAQAKAAATMGAAQIMKQAYPMVQDAAWRSLALGAGQGGAPSGLDPASLVQHVTPEKDRQKASEAIGEAQYIRDNLPKMLETFDKAAQDNTLVRRAGGLLGDSESARSLKTQMLPMLKDETGTLRENAMNVAYNGIVPSVGDKDTTTIRGKRQTLINMANSRYDKLRATAKAGGINLDNFLSTRPGNAK